jgi:hypothetical protein
MGLGAGGHEQDMSARVEMQAGGAPPEPERFRPTQLQRYGLWIATWLFALGIPLATLGIALASWREWLGLAAWFVPFALGVLGLLVLKGPFLPTPKPPGKSLLKALVYWILMLLCFACIALIDKVPSMRFAVLLILCIAGGAFSGEYFRVSGWRQVTESGFWFRLPPREWQIRQPRAKKPGGAHAG